ncbi:hypothetical protein [Nesterenkonia sp. CF4.4]|uniref:hypothetical protein n=1 Tax=Nesterenkonia sp. CF4.4 TaxID=3373079 RepID=UPI003EE79BCB
MGDQVSIYRAAKLSGVNMTSVTNAAVSGRLEYTTDKDGRMLVSLSAVRALAAAAGVRT